MYKPYLARATAPCAGEGPLQEVAVIHTLAEVPGSRSLLQHNATQDSAAELFEGGSLADVAAAASAASPQQVRICLAQTPSL